jgi:cell division protein FtsL
MTIIKPNEQRRESKKKSLVFLAIGILVISVVFCGALYSKTVDIKHEISSHKELLREGKVVNAELRNTLFKMTDPQMLEKIAEEKGLVEDKNPQWVFASL